MLFLPSSGGPLQEFSFGAIAHGVVPSGVRGGSPGLGGLAREAEAVCRHRLQILTAETIKI